MEAARNCWLLFALLVISASWPVSLHAQVSISEILAANHGDFQDEDGDASDWIELYNAGTNVVNLAGWHLTDDAANLAKWTFPGTNLDPHCFLIVWASGKHHATAGAPLHANFSLDSGGEYLALVNSNGLVVSAFDPVYPPQPNDVGYGAAQQITTTFLISNTSPARVFVPTNGNLGAGWLLVGFADSGWLAGTNGVGYQTSAPGFTLRNFVANVQVGSISAAESVISTPSLRSAIYSGNSSVINFLSTGGSVNYPNDSPFPGFSIGTDNNDFVLESVGHVTIPAPGPWTFCVNSDDGFSLTVGDFSMSFSGIRGSADSLQTFNFAAAGEYPVRLVYFERSLGSQVEMSAASGSFSSWNPTNFKLVGDTASGGLSVRSLTAGAADFGGAIRTDVQAAMANKNASVFIRLPFHVANPGAFQTLTLRAKFDDGFVAWLNGTEVARRNAPASPAWNSTATATRPNALAATEEWIDLKPWLNTLTTGTNVLAVQGLNDAASGDDFLFAAQLVETRATNLTNQFFATPTPGAFNTSAAYLPQVADTKFSHDRGFYETNFAVAITCATTGAVIRCTLDGSAPSLTNGFTYTNALPITNTTTLRAAAFRTGYQPSAPDTHTYLLVRDVLQQRENVTPGPGWPAAGVSGPQNQIISYGLASEVVNNPAYSGEVSNHFRALPTFSLVMDLDDLFGYDRGMYVHAWSDGEEWERPCSLELIQPDGGEGFQVNCGTRVRGGYSRDPNNPKHGLRFIFSTDYGPAKLNFPLLGTTNGAAQSFDAFDLRTFQNYSWSFGGDSRFTGLRDQLSRDQHLAMGQPGSRGYFCHLYINGHYWGLYNIDERPNGSYGESYFGGSKDQYDVVKVDRDSGYSIYATGGSLDAWFRLWQLATNGFPDLTSYMRAQGNNADGTRNSAYENLLDVDGLIDYMLVHLYSGDIDAPISRFLNEASPNNLYCLRNTNNTLGFQFITHDAEHTILPDSLNIDRFGPFPAGDPLQQGSGAFIKSNPGYLFSRLTGNAEFRVRFADHVQKHFAEGGALTVAANTARLNARSNEMYRAIIAESARWGNSKRAPSFARTDWLNAVSDMATFIRQRSDILLAQCRSHGLLPNLDAPVPNLLPGLVPAGAALTLSNPNATGQIYYTLDGSDPRLPGGAIATSALVYSTNLPILSHTFVRARVKNPSANDWSAIIEANFYPDQDFTQLIVSELMYNPPGAGAVSGDQFEFLELKNVGAVTLDLSGLGFSAGINFSFTNGTTLAPGQRFVLGRSAANLQTRYPGLAVNGIYTGKLDNSGERVAITNILGAEVLEFTYNDAAPWPSAADGFGFSLVPVNGNAPFDPDDPTRWRASAAIFGSPGVDDPAASIAPIVINEILTHETPTQSDAVELFNPTATNVNVGGWFLTDDGTVPTKYRIPNGTVIPAYGFLALDESWFNPVPGMPPSFSFSSHGEEVYLFSGDATTNLTGYSHGFSFGGAAQGVSFGRYFNSVGEEQFPAQSALTLGTNNASPLVGPVVLNEILYHPLPGGLPFVELKNITGTNVLLYDPAAPANTWRVNGLSFSFPSGTEIAANGFVIVAGADPAVFRAAYGVPASVPIYGPYAGTLQRSGERLELQRPGVPDTNGLPLITVDEVRYNDKAPWPVAADGDGPSLQRLLASGYGNEPTNWFSAGITPGGDSAFNVAPGVVITSPGNSASFAAQSTITLLAAGTDTDGMVTQVEFFDNGLPIGTAYDSPFLLRWTNVPPGSHTLTARATDNGFAATMSGPIQINVFTPLSGTGQGLRAQYYDNSDFTGTTVITTNATMNFDWGSGSPIGGIGSDTFSAVWTGMVQPLYSDVYTFYTVSDDGVRLYVNDTPLINNWNIHGATENNGSIALLAGQYYTIRMEYFEDSLGALAKLSWAATFQPKQIIPQSQLYPGVMPVIVVQPTSRAALLGVNVTFSVVATNSPTTYQWRFNGSPIAGATGTSHTVTNVQFSHEGTYTVAVSNSLGVVASVPATLTPMLAPVVTVQPQGQTVNAGSAASFNVGVSGTPPFSYQWRLNGTTLPGATSSRFTIASADVWQAGPYSVLVSNAVGSAVSSNAQLSVNAPATITVHPTNITFSSTNIVTTNTAFFNVVATGIGTLRYQWQFWGTNLPNATNALLAVSNVALAHAGPYAVTVSDDIRSVTSDAANLLLKVKPIIYVHPQSQNVVTNGVLSLSVLAGPIHPTLPMSYKWRKGGATVVSNGSPTVMLVLTNVSVTNTYSVVLSNAYGVTVTSSNATVVALADSDGDGLPDVLETSLGLSPTNAADALLDLDGDGMNNRQEYIAGTNPTNSQSVLRLELISTNGAVGVDLLRFTAIANKSYGVETAPVLVAEAWSNIVSIHSLPTNRVLLITNTPPSEATNRFYRVRVPLNP